MRYGQYNFDAIPALELAERGLNVGPQRVWSYAEGLADGRVAQASAHQLEDLGLARGQLSASAELLPWPAVQQRGKASSRVLGFGRQACSLVFLSMHDNLWTFREAPDLRPGF